MGRTQCWLFCNKVGFCTLQEWIFVGFWRLGSSLGEVLELHEAGWGKVGISMDFGGGPGAESIRSGSGKISLSWPYQQPDGNYQRSYKLINKLQSTRTTGNSRTENYKSRFTAWWTRGVRHIYIYIYIYVYVGALNI